MICYKTPDLRTYNIKEETLCIFKKQTCNIAYLFVDEPSILSIDPKPELNNGKLTVMEEETVGPYNCSADCNPPCEIKWRYKDINNNVHDASSNGHELSIQR